MILQFSPNSLKRGRDEMEEATNISAEMNNFSSQALPPQIMLLALPSILAQPPSHPLHICSLKTSLLALRKCLSIQNLGPDEECQICLLFAHVGMMIVGAGLPKKQGRIWQWAQGVELEVEKVLGRGLILCEKHYILRIYRVHLTCLSTRFSQWQHNVRLARSQLRHLQTCIYPPDPSYLHYMPHLSLISLSLSSTPPDIPQASQQITSFLQTAKTLGDNSMITLAHVIRLRALVHNGIWGNIPETLCELRVLLSLECIEDPNEKPPDTYKVPSLENDATGAAMAVHALLLAVVYYTQVGLAQRASKVLTCLHTILDNGALELFPDGYLRISLRQGPDLVVQCTHPRTLLQLAFLVSSVSKRECVGRKPRRNVFAEEGLAVGENEAKRSANLPMWSGLRELQGIHTSLMKIRADLICEIASMAIIRSEFENAEKLLNDIIRFTRSQSLFPSYSARIALHHGHLAHALGRSKRAKMCYKVAAHLAGERTWIWAAARTGEIGLCIGLEESRETVEMKDELRQWCHEACGTLQGVAKVLDACLSEEIVKSKSHLKASLDSATTASDNHLRALIMALTSSYYFHTAEDHAKLMLTTCRQLAAGMGAPEKSNTSSDPELHGNATLGLWVGQRFLGRDDLHREPDIAKHLAELYNRQNKPEKASKQKAINAHFEKRLGEMSRYALSQ